jgi:hypothetical protein
MMSEYQCKYNTKAEWSKINECLLRTTAWIVSTGKTAQQVATSVLSKMINSITKTIPYPLVMTSTYLSGFGDYWIPKRFVRHDYRHHQQALLKVQHPHHTDPMEREEVEHQLMQDDAFDVGEGHNHIQMADAVTLWTQRCDVLSSWSPIEVAMGFECGRFNTEPSKLFPLKDRPGYSHKPRLDRAKKAIIAIPQHLSEHPGRPTDDASRQAHEDYAAYALGNFYPWDTQLHMLHGDTLWDKFISWERDRPRDKQDDFAMQCLRHIELRVQARALMKVDAQQRKHIQHQVEEACCGPRDVSDASDHDREGAHSDDDEEQQLHAMEDIGLDDDTLERLANVSCLEDIPSDQSNYMMDTLSPLGAHHATVCHTPCEFGKAVHKYNDQWQRRIESATENLKDISFQKQLVAQDRAVEADKRIRIERSNTGGALHAIVSFRPLPATSPGEWADSIIPHGESLPYIRLPNAERPSLDDTIRLCCLCEEQEFAFRLIMMPLLRHMQGDEDVPQLTMTMLGGAGEFK